VPQSAAKIFSPCFSPRKPATTSEPRPLSRPHRQGTGQPGRRGCSRPGPQRSLPETRVAGNVEFLSSYVYRLVFNDNYSQAISSEVSSDLSLTHAAQRLHPLRLARPLSDLRQLHQRRRGQHPPPAQPALRRARPPARRLAALLGAGLVARLPQPLRAPVPRPQRGPRRLLSASFPAAFRRRMELRSRRLPCATPSTPAARIPT
jgi:hypothetical protein